MTAPFSRYQRRAPVLGTVLSGRRPVTISRPSTLAPIRKTTITRSPSLLKPTLAPSLSKTTLPVRSLSGLPTQAPDPKSWTEYRKAVRLAAIEAAKPKKKLSWWKSLLKSVYTPSSHGINAVKALPVYVAKAGQTAVGLGEMLLDVPTNVFNPDLWKTRYEQDLDRARAEGKGPYDVALASMDRSLPLLKEVVESFRRTGGRIAETATFGAVDVNQPGYDFYEAFKTGDLGTMLLEDVGNVILAGRLAGAGNVGVRLGEKIASSGKPRLGSSIATTGRFIEEPIGTTVRGLSKGLSPAAESVAARLAEYGKTGGRLAGVAERISPRLSATAETLGAMGGSETPLMTGAMRTSARLRSLVENNLAKMDSEIYSLGQKLQEADLAGRVDEVKRINDEMVKLQAKRAKRQGMSTTIYEGRRAQAEARWREDIKRSAMVAAIDRFNALGAAPDSVENMLKQATKLREEAARPTSKNVDAQLRQAQLLERMAEVKKANPEKLQDPVNRQTNFEAAMIVNSKLVDQIVADLNRGVPMDVIVESIVQPKELGPRTIQAGYAYTRAGVERAVDFVRGNLDQVDLLEMDIASQLINMVATEIGSYVNQPGTLVSGVLTPAQMGEIPIPEYVVAELGKRKFGGMVLRVLDEQTASIVVEGFPELADSLGDRLLKPEGLFAEYSGMRPDSSEYLAAYFALDRSLPYFADPATSVFARDPRLAKQVAEFFRDPGIYPASMRPMLAYEKSGQQMARSQDVRTIIEGLQQLAVDFPDMIGSGRAKTLANMLEALQKDPNLQYSKKFYNRLQDSIDGVRNDIGRKRTGVRGKLENIDARQIEINQRLYEIQSQARAAAAMVEQALFRPGELTGVQAKEVRTLRSEATRLDTEAGLLGGEPSQLVTLRKDLDAQSAKRTQLETGRSEAEQTVRDAETKLAAEESVLRQATDDAQQMTTFLSELDAAIALRERGLNREPLPSEQKAWKQERVATAKAEVDTAERVVNATFPNFEPPIMRREDFWVEDIWVRLKRGIQNEKHLREFFRRLTESKYEGVDGRIPTRAEMRVVDPNVGKPLKPGPRPLDEVANDMPKGPARPDEWVDEFTQAWTTYMEAVDRLKEIEKKPFKSEKSETVKDAMMRERNADLQQEGWVNPETGQTMYGVRPIENLQRIEKMLSDTEAFASQVDLVDRLRRDRDIAVRQLQDVNRQIADIDSRSREISNKINEMAATSPQTEAGRLRSEARQMRLRADKIEKEMAVNAPRLSQERLTITTGEKRLRVAKPTRLEGGDVVGYEFTKGVARKLDAAETAQLRQQANLHQQTRDLQVALNRQDAAIYGAEQTMGRADAYTQTLSRPTGPALLRSVERPRLLGEGTTPTWIPVGEASDVLPSARAQKKITTEGIAPQQTLSIEQRRQSTFMPLDIGQFQKRVSEILNETGRNRVVNRIITDQMFATNVETLLTPENVATYLEESRQRVMSDGIPRSPEDFDRAVQTEFGARVIDELARIGFEPVFKGRVANPDEPFAGGQAVGDLLGVVRPNDIRPDSLVMRVGLREAINTDFNLPGAVKLPPAVQRLSNFLQEKTAQWKSMVLPTSLRWQVGDAAGIVILAHVRAGIAPQDLIALMGDVQNRLTGGRGRLKLKETVEPLFGEAIGDPTISALVGSGLQTASIKTSEVVRSLPRGRTFATPVGGRIGRFMPGFREGSFNLNENINGMGRSAVALKKLQEALDVRGRSIYEIDPITVHNDPVLYEAVVDAVQTANDALGNFSKLTPSEKQFMKTVYPFWSWMRFINSAAAQLLLTQPDRVLFYAHLGSLALGDDAEEFYGWLNKQVPVPTPWGTMLVDLSFLNPYSDAILFSGNPFVEGTETAAGISPVLVAPFKTAGELYYGATGQETWPFTVGSRPGYLEGRPGETTRTFGDVLGGIGYQNFRTFAGPLRFLTEVAPTWRVPGTDVMLGPGPRYSQGSERTTGTFSKPLLSPTAQRIGAVLRSGGIPSGTADVELARRQASTLRRSGQKSLRRRQKERRLSRIGR